MCQKGYEHVQWLRYVLHFPEVVLSVALLDLVCPTLVCTSVCSRGKPRQPWRQEEQRRGSGGCPSSGKHPGGHIWARAIARQKSQGSWLCPLHSDTPLKDREYKGKKAPCSTFVWCKTADWIHCVCLMRKWWKKPQVLSIGSFCNAVHKLPIPFTELVP